MAKEVSRPTTLLQKTTEGITMFTRPPITTSPEGIYDFIAQEEEDDFVENYEEISLTYNPNVSLETQGILNCCELLIANYKPDQVKTIADVGCGAGFVINPIKGHQKTALDISLNQLRRVDDDIERIRCSAEDIPLESELFDVVICTDIFEHVLDEFKLIKEVKRILKPGGMLLFACPWKQDLSVYDLPEYKAKFKQYKYLHLRSINEETIDTHFSDMIKKSSTEITVAMSSMLFKPYSIMFFQFIKR